MSTCPNCDALRARAERAEAALVARHGGEPLALLAELDEAREALRQTQAVNEMFVREYVRHPEEYLKWQRGERHLCLSCGKAEPFNGCSALCPECLPPRNSAACIATTMAVTQAPCPHGFTWWCPHAVDGAVPPEPAPGAAALRRAYEAGAADRQRQIEALAKAYEERCDRDGWLGSDAVDLIADLRALVPSQTAAGTSNATVPPGDEAPAKPSASAGEEPPR